MAAARRISHILFALLAMTALALLSAACSSPESRACEVDANCFVDERCLAGFCQLDPQANIDARDADADPQDADADTQDSDAGVQDPDADAQDPNEQDADADPQDADSPCQQGLNLCDSSCVNVQTDPRFCGDCNTACADGEQCRDSACIPTSLPESGIVDTEGTVGLAADIVLDANGFPHISYRDATRGNPVLRYAYWDGVAWQTEDVTDIDGSRPTSISLDARGRPHILSVDASRAPEALVYAHHDGQQWLVETVHTASTVLFYDIALDPAGVPHIAYHHDVSLHLISRTGQGATAWTSSLIDTEGDPGRGGVAMLFDDQGVLHAAYRREALGGHLVFASRDSDDDGSNHVIADSGNPGSLIAMSRDTQGHFHIATRSTSDINQRLTYFFSDTNRPIAADNWTTVLALNHPFIAASTTSITVTPEGRAHLGYQTSGNSGFNARVLSYTGADMVESYSASSFNFSRTAVAADADNRVHIVYGATLDGNDNSGLYYHRIEE